MSGSRCGQLDSEQSSDDGGLGDIMEYLGAPKIVRNEHL